MPHLVSSIIAAPAASVFVVAWLLLGLIVGRRKPDLPCLPDVFDLPFEQIVFPVRDGIRLS
ncbi:MAG: hypothetical protein JXB07_19155 [Anaerolineae bacterium]|nr:hypothetical protein [Anaerolineae bacterium]